MTELIPGKRYRYTVEGKAGSDGVLYAGNAVYYVRPGGVVEELPDPLPTTPGSVVRDDIGDLFIVGDDGMWYSPGKAGDYIEDEFAHPVTVLFDAGKEF